jgi:ribosomal protein S21|tara:strand:+ start:380 stop:601 length:222 start_codon:yes stop_codon:yes gene_type:complete
MATNVTVRPRRGETPERMIRRFIKKCKKHKIIETYKARTDYYIKPSVKKKMKREKAIREKQKRERTLRRKMFR